MLLRSLLEYLDNVLRFDLLGAHRLNHILSCGKNSKSVARRISGQRFNVPSRVRLQQELVINAGSIRSKRAIQTPADGRQ